MRTPSISKRLSLLFEVFLGMWDQIKNNNNYSKNIKPSQRGELEITDVNNIYIQNNNIKVNLLGRGFAWLDSGTPNALLSASNFIQMIEERQGLKIACLEEIAYLNKFINESQLKKLIKKLPDDYANYLRRLITN